MRSSIYKVQSSNYIIMYWRNYFAIFALTNQGIYRPKRNIWSNFTTFLISFMIFWHYCVYSVLKLISGHQKARKHRSFSQEAKIKYNQTPSYKYRFSLKYVIQGKKDRLLWSMSARAYMFGALKSSVYTQRIKFLLQTIRENLRFNSKADELTFIIMFNFKHRPFFRTNTKNNPNLIEKKDLLWS